MLSREVIGLRIGDVLMHAWNTPDADEQGVKWGLTQLDGWFDGWDTSGGVDDRVGADGGWTSPVWAKPRVIHVGGTIRAGSWDAVTLAWERLMQQTPTSRLAEIVVSTGEGAIPEQSVMIRRHERPILSERFGGRAEFSLSLIAPDPRRYATTWESQMLQLPQTTGGFQLPFSLPFSIDATSTTSQAALRNDGNETTFPTMTVTGPCPAPFWVANTTTGATLTVHDSLLAGETLTIDMREHTATASGQQRRTTGMWWGLLPGENTVAFGAKAFDPDAAMTVTWRSAWS